MDNEFEKVCHHVSTINMNTPATAHTAKIERRIRNIKECCHGLLCTLPYKALPQQIPIHLLHFVVMWLNNFPSATSIFSTFSPRDLILWNCLDYNKHCRTPFGAYCETHIENSPTNSMAPCSIPSICLGPTGNLQGSYYFFSLVTGKIIKRRHLDNSRPLNLSLILSPIMPTSLVALLISFLLTITMNHTTG